ncbi:MAG: sporulation protein YunB [Clostridia bacterium]|nr:sporulation protein YunB [Clostridia bacterium]
MKIRLNGNFSKKLRFVCFFVAFSLIFTYLFLAVLTRFKPVFEEKVSHAAKTKAIDIINNATDDVFFDISSPDLVIIDKNENGSITSVSADTIEINRLKTKLSKSIQEYAENSENSTIYIPIGSLTNFSVLQGFGYRIPVNIVADGFAKIDFDDEFVSCGINQVKHKIFMTVSVRVSVVSAVFSRSETVTTEVPVAETVITGTVPTYYGDNMSILGR